MEKEKVYLKEESYEIVAAAIKVWKTLGYGFLEKVYENALASSLENVESYLSNRSRLQFFMMDIM
jgi:GxxExxY protein